jgi:hypothetical protein
MIPVLGKFRATARSESIANLADATFYFDPRHLPSTSNLALKNFNAEKSNVAVPVDMWLVVNGVRWELLPQGFRSYDTVEIGSDFPQFPQGLVIGASSEIGCYVQNTSGQAQIIQARLHGDLIPTGVFVARARPNEAVEVL